MAALEDNALPPALLGLLPLPELRAELCWKTPSLGTPMHSELLWACDTWALGRRLPATMLREQTEGDSWLHLGTGISDKNSSSGELRLPPWEKAGSCQPDNWHLCVFLLWQEAGRKRDRELFDWQACEPAWQGHGQAFSTRLEEEA